MTDTSETETSVASSEKKSSRRKFIIRGGLGVVGVVAIGSYLMRNSARRMAIEMIENMAPSYSGEGTRADLWFEILANNQVVVHSPKVEMGQGTFTGIAQMVADELDVTIDQIQVQAASTDTRVIDAMGTGGSQSAGGLWKPLRELAATMREMLRREAAAQMGIPLDELTTADGMVSGGGRTKSYADIAANVNQWTIPDAPPLRRISDYQYVGQSVPRIDLSDKVFGQPIFGMDAELPQMLHATVIRPEHVGATLKSADTGAAETMPGVVKIVQHDDWIGVVAESFPQAIAAKRKVKVQWAIPRKWTEADIRDQLQVGKGNEMLTQVQGSALVDGDAKTHRLEFTTPLGAHAQIEPNGAVASVQDDKATIILSTQAIGVTQRQVAEALELPLPNVNVIPTFLGGGFGRRLNTSHAIEAAIMSKQVGRPVKYTFTRQEEFQHDSFRPPTHHVVKGKLNDQGQLDALEHHYASGDVAIGSVNVPSAVHMAMGADLGAMRGGSIQYDKVPNHRAVQWHTTLPFATSWWRGLGLLANTFAIESFVDEMAITANQNPVDFRISQISDEGNGKRLKDVIRLAADQSRYVDKPQNDRAMGIAASIDTGSPCAHVVEVSVVDNQIQVHTVTCVLDCGFAVNPDQVKAQCEGCIIMGISAAMHERMTLKDGRLYPAIYGPYDMALMRNSPEQVDIHLIQGVDHPLPVGEPPMGPIAAAIANAVRRLTGQRLTDLPLNLSQHKA